MYYARIDNDNMVREVIPDIDPTFPDIPINHRYAPNILEMLIRVPDELDVAEFWTWDGENFQPPEIPEPLDEEPEVDEVTGNDGSTD